MNKQVLATLLLLAYSCTFREVEGRTIEEFLRKISPEKQAKFEQLVENDALNDPANIPGGKRNEFSSIWCPLQETWRSCYVLKVVFVSRT